MTVLALGACNPTPDLGFAIAVTVRFDDGIDAALRSSVTSLHVTSSGDEKGDYVEPLANGAAAEERFVFRPSAGTRSIALALAARNATGMVAEGNSGTLTLSAGKTTAVEVTLHAPGSDVDLGVDGNGDMSGPVSMLAFQHPDRYTGCAGARENTIGDFDGNGSTDVALVCNTAGTVQVFLNKGDGTFPSTPSTTTTVLAPTSLAAVDFDGDTHVDLVAVTSDGVHLLKNDGQAKFSDLATRALTGATTVSVADLDKDGVGDLLVSGSPTEVRVMWGTGVAASAFATSAALTVALLPGQVMAVDLDNDGYLDVVSFEPREPGKVESFHNNQAATARSFAAPATLDYSNAFSGVFQDVNNDGKPEGLFGVGSFGSYGFAVWSNSNGVLAPANGASLYPRGGLKATDMRLVDIDHDKIDDLVVVSGGGWYVTTHKGQGPLQFDTTGRTAYWAGGTTGHMHAADFDKDGFEDLVLIDGDGFTVVRGAADATLRAPEVFSFVKSDGVTGLWVSDLDKDGDQDIAYQDTWGGIYPFNNDGKGYMTSGPLLPIPSSSCGSGRFLTGGDINNDGQPDVLRTMRNCYDAQLGSPGGALTPGPASSVFTDEVPRAELADLDEDGKLDLVFITAGTMSHIKVSLGVGDGSFTATSTDIVIAQPRSLQLVDVNKDGHIDVVVAGGDNNISVLLNDGRAALAAPTVIAGPANLGGFAVFDYDSDGVVDLVAAGSALYLFKGGPGFSDAQRSSRSLLNPWKGMAIGDVNRDGITDLVGVSSFGIEILTGNGTSAFTTAHSFSFASGASSVIIKDIDGDQLADFIVSGGYGAAILRNLSR